MRQERATLQRADFLQVSLFFKGNVLNFHLWANFLGECIFISAKFLSLLRLKISGSRFNDWKSVNQPIASQWRLKTGNAKIIIFSPPFLFLLSLDKKIIKNKFPRFGGNFISRGVWEFRFGGTDWFQRWKKIQPKQYNFYVFLLTYCNFPQTVFSVFLLTFSAKLHWNHCWLWSCA